MLQPAARMGWLQVHVLDRCSSSSSSSSSSSADQAGAVRSKVYLEASILGKLEAAPNRGDCVASVGVPSHILIRALQTHLQPSAAICQHLQRVTCLMISLCRMHVMAI